MAEPISGSAVIPIDVVLLKFAITMGSVFASIIVIWLGLRAFKDYAGGKYNKPNPQNLYGDTYETPKTMDDAIISFIDKNRL